ncbi:phage tail protein [Candidatus Regiella insecticola]|uniref:Tail protein n=1 Tax=Candidatus Regiella insecticola TaxID=138073 RepID=A0A6L2ZPM8_9ENTR|nr:phage tail protein [Candidatus Regiella insecticola]GFN46370.1 tail protein [Candidatus Regiella insecticola]
MLMQLGSYIFKLNSAPYQSLGWSSEYRWPTQERIDGGSARQWVGFGAEEIRLEGTLYPSFTGGLEQIKQLRTLADDGKPLRLVGADGQDHGRWCITHIDDTGTIFDKLGNPRKIDFNLMLSRYWEDATQ